MTRRRCEVMAVAAALLMCAPEAAHADPLVVDRLEAEDGTVFTLTAGSSLTGSRDDRQATFRFDADPLPGRAAPYGEDGLVTSVDLALADRRTMLVAGSTIACGEPGASGAYGTVVRRARRIVATLVGGRRIRLERRRPPRAWRFDGWVVGGVVEARRGVRRVDAYDRRGRRIARAPFGESRGCPT